MKLRDLREKLRGEAALRPTSEPRTPPGLFKGESAKCPFACEECGGLGTIEEDDGHAGRYGGRIVDCKHCGGRGSVSLRPPSYPGTPEPMKFDIDIAKKGGRAADELFDLADELTKRGIDPEDVESITVTKPLEGPERADISLDSGKVLKLAKGLDIKIIPDKGLPTNTIVVMNAGVGSVGPPSVAAIYAAEAVLRALEKMR